MKPRPSTVFVVLVALVTSLFLVLYYDSVFWGPREGFIFWVPRYPRLTQALLVAGFIVPSLGPFALVLRLVSPFRMAKASMIAAAIALVGTPLVLLAQAWMSQYQVTIL